MTDLQIVAGVSAGLCLFTWLRIVRTGRRNDRYYRQWLAERGREVCAMGDCPICLIAELERNSGP